MIYNSESELSDKDKTECAHSPVCDAGPLVESDAPRDEASLCSRLTSTRNHGGQRRYEDLGEAVHAVETREKEGVSCEQQVRGYKLLTCRSIQSASLARLVLARHSQRGKSVE